MEGFFSSRLLVFFPCKSKVTMELDAPIEAILKLPSETRSCVWVRISELRWCSRHPSLSANFVQECKYFSVGLRPSVHFSSSDLPICRSIFRRCSSVLVKFVSFFSHNCAYLARIEPPPKVWLASLIFLLRISFQTSHFTDIIWPCIWVYLFQSVISTYTTEIYVFSSFCVSLCVHYHEMRRLATKL